MSLQAIILSLIAEIGDAALRTDIASTIIFLRDLYLRGQIGREDLAEELRGVVRTVLEATQPALLPEELEERTREIVDQLLRAISLDAMRARLMSKYRPPRLPE